MLQKQTDRKRDPYAVHLKLIQRRMSVIYLIKSEEREES